MAAKAPDWMITALGIPKDFDGESWVPFSLVQKVLDRAQENIETRHETIEHFKRQANQFYKTATKKIADELANDFRADWLKLSDFNQAICELNEIKVVLREIAWSDGWEKETALKKVQNLVRFLPASRGRENDNLPKNQVAEELDSCVHCAGLGGTVLGSGILQCSECFGLNRTLSETIKTFIRHLQAKIFMFGLNIEMANKTFVLMHNPFSPKKCLLRLPHRGNIDNQHTGITEDNFGYGDSPNQAYIEALKMQAARK